MYRYGSTCRHTHNFSPMQNIIFVENRVLHISTMGRIGIRGCLSSPTEISSAITLSPTATRIRARFHQCPRLLCFQHCCPWISLCLNCLRQNQHLRLHRNCFVHFRCHQVSRAASNENTQIHPNSPITICGWPSVSQI